MGVTSAGLLVYRLTPYPEVLIAHMGGPYWSGKDAAAWSIPKGEYDAETETAVDAALREFAEELGVAPPDPPYAELGTFAYSSGKRVTVFVVEGGGFEASGFVFGEFELEWPPRSGSASASRGFGAEPRSVHLQSFPEVDRAEWTSLDAARGRLVKGQRAAIDALERHLDEVSG